MSVFSNPNSLTGGPYVMGIDFGTESCRVGIFDLNGAPVAFAATAYPTPSAPGWAEQSPVDWWNALRASVHSVMQRSGVQPHEIKGISYDATTMTVVALDHGGEALRPAIMWMDVRATEQAARVVDTTSPARRYTGGGTLPPTAEWFPFKAAWLRENERETYDKAYRLVDAPDWLTYRLTGEWTQNINTAAHRMYYDRDNGGWPVDSTRRPAPATSSTSSPPWSTTWACSSAACPRPRPRPSTSSPARLSPKAAATPGTARSASTCCARARCRS